MLQWLTQWKPVDSEVGIVNVTSEYAMIAVQGTEAVGIVDSLCDIDASAVRSFTTVPAIIGSSQAWLARTDYTGEDGFQIVVTSDSVGGLWRALVDGSCVPCGLGARDVLRLEAGLLLHGNDMDTNHHPYEAGLDRFVKPDRKGYVASPALTRIRDESLSSKLVGLVVTG